MKKYFLLLLTFILHPLTSQAEVSGYVAVEGRGFTHSPPYEYSGQKHNDGALIVAPEFYKEFDDGSQFVFSPFYMEDSGDEERSHGDIRELYYHKVWDSAELSFGVKKIFWGVTESQHVVDIINQTDMVSSFDGEDKLGQPMVHFSKIISTDKELGTLDFFIMPYFRERTYPGVEGRLRGPVVITSEYTEDKKSYYESDKKDEHVDYAVRYSNYLGPVDFSLSHFSGTSREPSTFLPPPGPTLPPIGFHFIPFYPLINQTGLTTQVILGEWIWKLEVMHRNGRRMSYEVATAGFEYTFTGIFNTKADLGTLLEYHYDSRGEDSPSPFEDDVMGGFRLAVNDLGSTEVLGGVVQSLQNNTKYYFIEASRRLTDNMKISFEGRSFSEQPLEDPIYFLKNDDHMLLELAYYF